MCVCVCARVCMCVSECVHAHSRNPDVVERILLKSGKTSRPVFEMVLHSRTMNRDTKNYYNFKQWSVCNMDIGLLSIH